MTDSCSSTTRARNFFSFFFVKEETFFLFFSFEASLLFASLIIDNFSIKAGEGTKEQPALFSLSLRALLDRGGREQRAYRLDRVLSLSPSLRLSVSPFFLLLFVFSSFHDFFHSSALRTRNEGKRSSRVFDSLSLHTHTERERERDEMGGGQIQVDIGDVDDPVDPKLQIEELCKPKCEAFLKAYEACAERIEGDETGEKHCTGQYFDFWSCVDHCAVGPTMKHTS